MSYPISKEQIEDPFIRGQVDMFVKLVEYRNDFPRVVDDTIIEALHQSVEKYCQMRTEVIIEVKDGSSVVEVTERD